MLRDRIRKYLEVYFRWPALSDVTSEVMIRYSEPWRGYHNLRHIETLLDALEDNPVISNNKDILNQLAIVAIFHDIVYKPWKKDNEEKSAQLFKKLWKKHSINSENRSTVEHIIVNCILQTKNHDGAKHFDRVFNSLDMAVISGTKEEVMEWEKGISKEYSFVPYGIYKKHRIEFLEEYSEYPNIKMLIEYVQKRKKFNNSTTYFIGNYTKHFLNKISDFFIFE